MHILMKDQNTNNNEKILAAAAYDGTPVRLAADFSLAVMDARR